MSVPIWKFIEAEKTSTGELKYNESAVEKLRDRYKSICQQNGKTFDPEVDVELDDDVLNKLIEYCHLIDNDQTRSYIDNWLFSTPDDLHGKVVAKMSEVEELKQIPMTINSNASNSTISDVKSVDAKEQSQIVCIIHRKSQKKEVEEFFSTFLFRQIREQTPPTTMTTNQPIFDGKAHPLTSGSLLDVFIRKELKDRGDITLSSSNEKLYRLVEPVSLSDEFSSWTFDLFCKIFDLWLSIDGQSQKPFPIVWKFNSNGQIDYVITNDLFSNDENSSKTQSGRPSTKDLASFIQGICRIETNNNASDWLGKFKEENITTYAHLSNLNEEEWKRINKLPMNALKTIRFYVDQAKQSVEERKVDKIPTTPGGSTEEKYSVSKILADLHMVKLYFNYQLVGEKNIENLPRLEKKCVELAFKEIRDDGYEEDGLFEEMQMFFQPLTVTDEELIIDKKDLEKIERKNADEKEKYRLEVDKFQEQLSEKEKERIKIVDDIEKNDKERIELWQGYSAKKENPNLSDEDKEEAKIDWLDKNKTSLAKSKSLQENKKEIENQKLSIGNELKNAQENYDNLKLTTGPLKTKIDRKKVKIHRGFIMYGPPGTGKSVIMTQLAEKIGVAMLGPPLASGELERPLVGQSEAIISDLAMRGNRLPHLICCLSIDEIDSLAPKRDEDSSEGKVAKISVLLSVIEGIKDVPNLMFFSATNRLHMMDEAFLRRMSGKFFVGRPSAKARERILNQVHLAVLPLELKKRLTVATTNFSGAALSALNSAINVHYLTEKRKQNNEGTPSNDETIDEEKALELADQTARRFQIFLGLDTLPRLLLQNLQDQRRTEGDESGKTFHLPYEEQCTGRIIISLYHRTIKIEIIRQNKDRDLITMKLEDTERNLQQLIERITWYGRDRNVQLLQLIDLNLLSSRGAYEEKKIFETLKERYDECMEYKRSMIIYDLDSLIGVGESESNSSMGVSVSTNLVNQGVYIYISSRFREANIEQKGKTKGNDENSNNKERWAVAVCRDPFLLKKFSADVDFGLNEEQKRKQEEEERRRAEMILRCFKCRDSYVEGENKMSACSYHDGFVYDNSTVDLKEYTPTDAINLLNYEEYRSFTSNDEDQNSNDKDEKSKDKEEKKKTRFKYICCHAVLTPGASFNGCKKGKHECNEQDAPLAKSTTVDEDSIASWEKSCLTSKENLKRKGQLLKIRKAK